MGGPTAMAFTSIKGGPTAMKGGTASPTTSKREKYSQLPTALLICRNFFVIAMLHKMHPTCTVFWYAGDFAGIVCVVLFSFFLFGTLLFDYTDQLVCLLMDAIIF